MTGLDKNDYLVLTAARETIKANYDAANRFHTVGAAVMDSDGNIHRGINLYSVHSACAEQVALGRAMTDGIHSFKCIVAVTGENGEAVIPPCGSCRQLLADNFPDCYVILEKDGELFKCRASDLLPYPYITPCI